MNFHLVSFIVLRQKFQVPDKERNMVLHTSFYFLMTDQYFRLSYLHVINTLKLLLKKIMQTSG